MLLLYPYFFTVDDSRFSLDLLDVLPQHRQGSCYQVSMRSFRVSSLSGLPPLTHRFCGGQLLVLHRFFAVGDLWFLQTGQGVLQRYGVCPPAPALLPGECHRVFTEFLIVDNHRFSVDLLYVLPSCR